MAYNAFISYSHAADDKLSSAVQSALKTFAKPWNKRRALEVFRDQTNLSATPALWPSIEKALSESQYFILMASPEAAKSKWVRKEIEYWLNNKSAEKILIILTEGNLVWNEAGKDFLWEQTTSLPPNFRNVFSSEPKWVDLKWIKSEEDLSLRNPEFNACIARIAAPLHGKELDEITGEDVRHHKYTMRRDKVFKISIATFGIVACGAAVFAYFKMNEAEFQAGISKRQFENSQVARAGDIWRDDPAMALKVLENVPQEKRDFAWRLTKAAATQNRLNIKGHLGLIWSVAYSTDGSLIATGGGDRLLKIWNSETGDLVNQWKTDGPIHSVGFSPIGSFVAAVSEGNEDLGKEPTKAAIALWNYDTGDLINKRELPGKLNNSQGNNWFAFASSDLIVFFGSAEGKIWAWDARKDELSEWGWIEEPVHTLKMSADDKILAIGAGEGRGETIYVCDFATKTLMRKITGVNGKQIELSPNGKILAAISTEPWKAISVWDTETGCAIATLVGHDEQVMSIAFSKDSRFLVSGSVDRTVKIWSASAGNCIGTLTGHNSLVYGVAISRDYRIASVTQDGVIKTWDFSFGMESESKVLAGHKSGSGWSVYRMAISTDVAKLATVVDNYAELWDCATNVSIVGVRIRPSQPQWVAFSPDNKKLAVLESLRSIVIMDSDTGGQIGAVKIAGGSIGTLTFSPDSKFIALATDGGLVLRNLQEGKEHRFFSKERNISAVAFSPKDNIVAVGTADSVKLLYLDSSAEKEGFAHPFVGALAFSKDGKLLASGSGWNRENRDAMGEDVTIKLWDVYNQKKIGTLHGHVDEITSIAFSIDGELIASSSRDKTIKLWDSQTGFEVLTLKSHEAPVISVSFIGDNRLVSGSMDGEIKIWGKEVQETVNLKPDLLDVIPKEIPRNLRKMP